MARSAGTGMRLVVADVWAGLAAAVGYVLAFNPTDRIADPTGPCTWHTLFGINGPICGGTRMVWYLLHGDLVAAARHHLVALIGVPFASQRGWPGRHRCGSVDAGPCRGCLPGSTSATRRAGCCTQWSYATCRGHPSPRSTSRT